MTSVRCYRNRFEIPFLDLPDKGTVDTAQHSIVFDIDDDSPGVLLMTVWTECGRCTPISCLGAVQTDKLVCTRSASANLSSSSTVPQTQYATMDRYCLYSILDVVLDCVSEQESSTEGVSLVPSIRHSLVEYHMVLLMWDQCRI